MTWELLEGEQEIATEWPEDAGYTVPGTENVFIYSLTDGTPSATAATLAKTGENIYAGFCNFTPDYTFKFGDDETPSSADKVYGAAPVSSEEANYRLYSGEDMEPISYLGSGNAFAYVTVDFDARSWSYEAVSSVSLDFNTGDDISMTGNAGVYTAEAEISSWGSGIRFSVNEAALTYTDAEPDGTLAAGEGYFTPTTDVENGHRYRIKQWSFRQCQRSHYASRQRIRSLLWFLLFRHCRQ